MIKLRKVLPLFLILFLAFAGFVNAQFAALPKVTVGEGECIQGGTAVIPVSYTASSQSVSVIGIKVEVPGFADLTKIEAGSALPTSDVQIGFTTVYVSNLSTIYLIKVNFLNNKPFSGGGEIIKMNVKTYPESAIGEFPINTPYVYVKVPPSPESIKISGEPGKLIIKAGVPVNGNLEGTVTECDTATGAGAAIQDAHVFISKISATDPAGIIPICREIKTDANGYYIFGNIPFGAYKVVFEKFGYKPETREIDIASTLTEVLDVCLLPVSVTPVPTATPITVDKGTLKGKITECSTLTVLLPIKGAKIIASIKTAANILEFTAFTNENGVFELCRIPAGNYEISIEKDGYTSGLETAEVFKDDTTFVGACLDKISTDPTPVPGEGSISGTVSECTRSTDSATSPIQGVKVIAVPEFVDCSAAGKSCVSETYTDDFGAYTFDKLPSGKYLVKFAKDGYKTASQKIEINSGDQAVLDTCLEKCAQPGVSAIHGFVFTVDCSTTDTTKQAFNDGTHIPIADAKVILLTPGSRWGNLVQVAETLSDAKGEFLFKDIATGYYIVKVVKDGFHPAQKEAKVWINHVTEIQIRLHELPSATPTPIGPDKGDLFGTVKGIVPADKNMVPLEDASIFVYPTDWKTDPTIGPIASAKTDSEGAYEIKDLASGPVIIVAEAVGFDRQMRPSFINDKHAVRENFILKPIETPVPVENGSISGIVYGLDPLPVGSTDVPTSHPIEKAKVGIYPAICFTSRAPEPVAVVFTDINGLFSVDDIKPGKYIVKASADGYISNMNPVFVYPDKISSVILVLRPEIAPTPTPLPTDIGSIKGRVCDEQTTSTAEKPIENAKVICVKSFDPKDPTGLSGFDSTLELPSFHIPGIPVAITTTDANGEYSMPNIPAGDYKIICIAEKYYHQIQDATVKVDEETIVNFLLKAIEIPVLNPGKITGYVLTPIAQIDPQTTHTINFQPVEDSTITAVLFRHGINETDPIAPAAVVVTDANGYFEMTDLEPAKYLVTVEKDGFKSKSRVAVVKSDKVTEIRFVIIPVNDDIPSDSPLGIVDNNFKNNADGWAFGSSIGSPTGDYRDGMLKIFTNSNLNNFGFWQMPSGAVNNIAGMIYKLKVAISTDQEDQTKVPTIRLRSNSNDFTQSDEFGITSAGAADFSPNAAGKLYTFFFKPRDNGMTYPRADNDGFFAFDIINVDPADAAVAMISLKSVIIESIIENCLKNETIVKEYTFDSGEEGWVSGGAPKLDQPTAVWENGALTLKSASNTATFGTWAVLENIAIDPSKIYLIKFQISSDQTDSSVVPTIRCRATTSDQQASVVKTITSNGEGINSPTIEGKEYTLILNPQPTTSSNNLFIAVDMLNINPDDAADAVINIENVKVVSYDLP